VSASARRARGGCARACRELKDCSCFVSLQRFSSSALAQACTDEAASASCADHSFVVDPVKRAESAVTLRLAGLSDARLAALPRASYERLCVHGSDVSAASRASEPARSDGERSTNERLPTACRVRRGPCTRATWPALRRTLCDQLVRASVGLRLARAALCRKPAGPKPSARGRPARLISS